MTRDDFLKSINATNEACQDLSNFTGSYKGNDTVGDVLERLSDYETAHPGTLTILCHAKNHTYRGTNPNYNGHSLYMMMDRHPQDPEQTPVPMMIDAHEIYSVMLIERREGTNK